MPLFTPLAKKLFRRKPVQESLPGVEVANGITRRREREGKKSGRRTIVILFALTVLASLFFYLKTEIPFIWQKLTSPAVISDLPKGKSFSPNQILNKIETLTKNLSGSYGVCVYELETKESYGIKKDETFTAASLIKLPVMLTAYQEAEAGRLNLDKYRSLLEAMGKRSDNVAFNTMVKILGQTKIQAAIGSLGMKSTSFAKNDTAPADIGLFFQKLYQGNLISKQHRDEFLGFLTDTIYEDRIPAGIPDDIRVAHKIGTEVGSYSDAGIIFAPPPAGGFILVIMSDGARESEAKIVLPQIAKVVWEFENR